MTQQKLPTSQGGRHFKPPHLETDKPIDMEIDDETTYCMDEDPPILMLREEGTWWEMLANTEAITELKN